MRSLRACSASARVGGCEACDASGVVCAFVGEEFALDVDGPADELDSIDLAFDEPNSIDPAPRDDVPSDANLPACFEPVIRQFTWMCLWNCLAL